jgi:hypothetical protein
MRYEKHDVRLKWGLLQYLRFVIQDLDEDSGRRQGLFQTLVDIQDRNELYQYEIERIREIGDWFNVNLKKPSSFTRSSKPRAINKAISWFKDSADEHIAYMREIAAILEGHGVHTEIIRTERPGYIVYEDEYQITAEPFSDSGA